MVNTIAIIVCSTLFYHGFYQALKQGLVRRLFQPLVRWKTGQKAFVFSDGDVAHVSELTVSFTNGIVASVCSLIVLWQARADLIYARAPLLVPCTHWIAQYFIYDNYAMYQSAYYRKGLMQCSKFSGRLAMFVKKKWSMILHHGLLLGFGYVLVTKPDVRSYKGDFMVGMFFLRELWNPFQNLAQILKQLQLGDTVLYYTNGVSLVLVQLVVRVLNWPLVVVIYAAQYHNWDIVSSLYHLYPMCIIATTIWQSLEMYWFWMIIQLIAGYTKKKSE